MAWFGNWFAKKNATADGFASDPELFDQNSPGKSAATKRNVSDRKSARLEQRELLYTVVRECMARLGMNTANYKYKVLSLDSQGRQYLIMMDFNHDLQIQAPFMLRIERLLIQEAQTRHNIQITGVYWRLNDSKTPLEPEQPQPEVSAKPPKIAPPPAPAPIQPVVSVDAKKALEKVLSKPREQRPATPTAFQDTLVMDSEDRRMPPSGHSKLH